jgi:hypothetical protein
MQPGTGLPRRFTFGIIPPPNQVIPAARARAMVFARQQNRNQTGLPLRRFRNINNTLDYPAVIL